MKCLCKKLFLFVGDDSLSKKANAGLGHVYLGNLSQRIRKG